MEKKYDDLREQIVEALRDGASLEDLGIEVKRIVIASERKTEPVSAVLADKGISVGKVIKWMLIGTACGLITRFAWGKYKESKAIPLASVTEMPKPVCFEI